MAAKTNKTLTWLAGMIFLLSGCVKDRPNPGNPVLPSHAAKKLLVVCEGSLGNGNSSLTLYRPDVDSVYADVFSAANGLPPGDVFQSIRRIGEQYFLCVNNSDKIVVINRDDFKITGIISVPKPRYLLPVSSTKAYVSTLFSDKVYIIDPGTLELTGSFSVPARNAEGMLLYDDKVFICPWDTSCSNIYTVGISGDSLLHSIPISGSAPQEILLDKEQKLWVLSGNVAKGKAAALTRLDPGSGAILKTYLFPPDADPFRPVFNKEGDTLYFIEVNYNGGTANNGIYRMSIYDPVLPAQPFIPAAQYQYFWALGIEPGSGNIYVGDPKGFVQKGMVRIYSTDGIMLKQFQTGVGPGHFYFDY